MMRTINTWLTRLLLTLCIAIYAGHLGIILRNAVNVPFWDEWGILSPNALPAGFTFSWIFEQANEHRIVLTKLQTWVLFYLGGHNQILSLLVAYALWGVLLACIVMFARRVMPEVPVWVVLAFILLLLTPINWENNSWGFESCYRFAVLFSLLTAYFLFNERQTGSRLALGVAMSVLAIYSFFAGLLAVCILILLFACFKITRVANSAGAQRKRELVQSIAVVSSVLIFIALYFVGYHSVSYHPQFALPYDASFWRFFTNLVSWGFGFETNSVILGALCLLLVLAPVAATIWQQRLSLSSASWGVYAFLFAWLGVLASIAMGRANYSPSAKISRYADFAMMLVPFTALAWAIFLKDKPKLKRYALAGLWVFCCLGFSYKWLWFPVYRVQRDSRLEGVECIKSYYKSGGPGICPTLYAAPLGQLLDDGKKLNLSFYRDIKGEL